MVKPLVSVIIANWNGGVVFEECLLSLSKITYTNWELIIVDNGSSDGSASLAKKFNLQVKKIKVLQNSSNLGFAKANNQWYKKSEGEHILLLNNDTKVTPKFLDDMVEKMESE